MAKEDIGVNVVPKGDGQPETLKVVCPKGQGVTHGDQVSSLYEETVMEIEFGTALELLRRGYVRLP